ncbi:uncharacterized protein METZ01_LOCUS397804 [marine metagenome]|uniref:Uncharacterized protein n=1 Tax=marine metagenome TaxID=408172 RepID=A0A382VEY2_9ZZZZ
MVAIPATILAKEIGKRGTKASGEFLEKKLGYNFVDLVTKLALFYIIAFLIAKYMEAIIYFQGGLSTIAGFFGIKMAQADQLPKQWVELFVDTNQQTYTSTPTGAGQFNPPGWDRPYDYGTPEHQEAEPYLFPEKEVKFKFWDLVNAIVIFYIGWETYKYYRNGGRDFLTIAIFSMLGLMVGVLSFSKFLGKFSLNRFQEENK